MSLVCANSIKGDYAVIGVDLANKDTYWKIKSINDGKFPSLPMILKSRNSLKRPEKEISMQHI